MVQNFSSNFLIKMDQIFKTINLKQAHSILFLLVRKWSAEVSDGLFGGIQKDPS